MKRPAGPEGGDPTGPRAGSEEQLERLTPMCPAPSPQQAAVQLVPRRPKRPSSPAPSPLLLRQTAPRADGEGRRRKRNYFAHTTECNLHRLARIPGLREGSHDLALPITALISACLALGNPVPDVLSACKCAVPALARRTALRCSSHQARAAGRALSPLALVPSQIKGLHDTSVTPLGPAYASIAASKTTTRISGSSS